MKVELKWKCKLEIFNLFKLLNKQWELIKNIKQDLF